MSRSVGSLALPITISILADSLLSIVALGTVSRISTTAVAAAGLVSYLFFLVNALATVFTGGLMVVASQAIGAGEEGVAGRATGETITLSLIASTAFMLTAPLWLPHYLNAVSSGNREVASMALEYAVARLFSLPALMLNVSLGAAYRSADKPWPSAYSSAISVAVGSLLVPAMTLGGPGIQAMGLKGAGIATTLASYAGLVAYAVWRPPFKVVIARPSLLGFKVIVLGAPTALERLVASIAQNVYVSAVAKAGTKALAAHNIGVTVEMLVIQPSFAVSLAALVRAGQHVGSDSVGEAERSLKESIKVGALWMGLAALLLSLISPYVGPLFTSDPEVARLVQVYLLLAAASEVGLGVSSAVYGAMRGMGSVWLPLAINSFTVVFFRAIPAQVLADTYGAVGAWVTQNTDMYGRALLALLAWKLLGARRLARKVV